MRKLSSFVVMLFGSLSASAPSHAVEPIDELLRRTPSDAHFVLIVKDLRNHAMALTEGPFAPAFRTSRVGKSILASPEFGQINEVVRQLSQAAGVTWSQLRDDVLGDALVFSYQAGPVGQPDKERGIALAWVRDPKLVADVIKRIDAIQIESGELREVRTRSHGGEQYVERVKAAGAPEFVFRQGALIAISAQEPAIKELIELHRAAGNDADAGPMARKLDSLGARDAIAALLLNPRSFDAELTVKASKAAGAEAAFLTTFSKYWKAIDGIAVKLQMNKSIDVSLSMTTEKSKLPREVLRLAEDLSQSSDLAAIFPDDALISLSARIDPRAFLTTLASFTTMEAFKSLTGSIEQSLGPVLGKKYVAMLPEHLGPDVGVCVLAPTGPATTFPDAVVAVRIRPSTDGNFERAVRDACDAAMALARVQLNMKSEEPANLETIRDPVGDIRYLSHSKLLPPGINPAFSLRGGFLMIGTNPEAIGKLRLDHKGPAKSPARLLNVSLRGWREYLEPRRDMLPAALSANTPEARLEMQGQLDRLLMFLELFDRFELVNESTLPARIRLSAKLYPLKPLRK